MRSRLLLVIGLLVIGVLGLTFPMGAQDSPIFATNTPPAPTPVKAVLDAPFEQYALRQWLEPDLLDVLGQYIRQLSPDDPDTQRAVQLIQYELEQRFPGAPRNFSQRETLVQTMLAAPRGSVDMRAFVRPYIQTLLNQRAAGSISFSNEYQGFLIEETPANLDGIDPNDALIHIRYPATVTDFADIRYEDYVLAQIDIRGNYHLLGATIPAAPFGAIQTVSLQRLADLNKDTRTELAVLVQTGDLNEQMQIFGWRNGSVISLIAPNQDLRFGKLVNWSQDGLQLSVLNYRVDSLAWQCVAEQPLDWSYTGDFFRPEAVTATKPLPEYKHQATLACHLFELEPIFQPSGDKMIQSIQDLLAQSSRDEPGAEYAYERAQMSVAMLYALNGQPSQAMDAAKELQSRAQPGSWLEGQTNAFLSTISQSGATAITVCQALLQADTYGACDMDQVLARSFTEQPLRRDQPLVDQLQERRMPVLETATVTEVGKATRTVVNFNLVGASWWAFAPLNKDVYFAERSAPPPGFEAAELPPGLLPAPDSAYEALLVQNNPVSALNILDNAVRDNPGIPLSPAAQYLRALSYDLVADRIKAKQAYFNLWKAFPDSVWGQLAAAHLEKH